MSFMERLLFIILIWIVPFAAEAQDREGRNTPSDWRVEHYVPFGLWDSVCDERAEDDVMKQRCYLRYVEVYSPRPNFLATFAFIYPKDGQSVVEIGFERRTRYTDLGFRVVQGDDTIWTLDSGCLRSSPCRLTGSDAQSLLAQFAKGDTLIQEFKDRSGKNWRLEWDLTRFDEALKDYRKASKERALLN